MKGSIALAVVIVAAVTMIGAQTPTRDAPRAVAVGAASIAGTVIADDETRAPMRRAILSLSRAGVNDTRLIASDDEGRYRFDQLPAGVYTLSASKGGYISTNYGAPRAGLPGNPIPIAAAQQFRAAPIPLMHGAVITGRLLDRQGHPIQFSNVFATQFDVVNGERRRRTLAGASRSIATDAHGTYRLFGLLPGEYIVSATALETLANSVRVEVTAPEVDWAQQQARGGLLNPAAPGAAPAGGTGPATARPYQYAATYYPGTADPSGAVTIALRRGEERAGVDFQMQYSAVAGISGVITAPDGQPLPDAAVVREYKKTAPLLVSSIVTASVRSNAAGAFSMPGVAPGDYTVIVRAKPLGIPSSAFTLWGSTDVSVGSDDISNLAIQLQLGMSISGKVVFEGASPAPSDLKAFSLRVVAAPGSPISLSLPPGTIDPSLSFKFEGAAPARYLMKVVAPAGARWTVKSATVAEKDALDNPFEVHPHEDVTGVVVTLSDQQTELSGTLVDAAGHPTPQFYLLAFPTDKRCWTTESRWIRSTRADVAGGYRMIGLPAGDYYLCALTEIDPSQQFDPAYLEQFVPASIKITLKDGEKKTQTLRVGG